MISVHLAAIQLHSTPVKLVIIGNHYLGCFLTDQILVVENLFQTGFRFYWPS